MSTSILGFHLLQLLLDVVGVELVLAGEVGVVAHGSSVSVEIKAVLVADDDGFIE